MVNCYDQCYPKLSKSSILSSKGSINFQELGTLLNSLKEGVKTVTAITKCGMTNNMLLVMMVIMLLVIMVTMLVVILVMFLLVTILTLLVFFRFPVTRSLARTDNEYTFAADSAFKYTIQNRI